MRIEQHIDKSMHIVVRMYKKKLLPNYENFAISLCQCFISIQTNIQVSERSNLSVVHKLFKKLNCNL